MLSVCCNLSFLLVSILITVPEDYLLYRYFHIYWNKIIQSIFSKCYALLYLWLCSHFHPYCHLCFFINFFFGQSCQNGAFLLFFLKKLVLVFCLQSLGSVFLYFINCYVYLINSFICFIYVYSTVLLIFMSWILSSFKMFCFLKKNNIITFIYGNIFG